VHGRAERDAAVDTSLFCVLRVQRKEAWGDVDKAKGSWKTMHGRVGWQQARARSVGMNRLNRYY
jgi:hypothetical protein